MDEQWVAVVDIPTGTLLHCSRWASRAAVVLRPGTCFGKDEDKAQAIKRAIDWATWFRERP
jgi:hypothetical protein